MKKLFSSLRSQQNGVGAVEFALVLPIFLIVVIGAIELGISFLCHSGLAHGVNEAARFATVHPTPSDSDIERRVRERVFGVFPEKLKLTITRGNDRDLGAFVTIRGDYVHHPVTSYLGSSGMSFTETRKAWIQSDF